MKSLEIRQKFFDFFKKHNHTQVNSSSLIPAEDPTLLFTNAGMNQFKDLFLGKEKRDYTRAVSIQKCIRAGGKHNDLENVGFTQRHLTFFEMMGNFSFGDYFKKEAIEFAWDFLTNHIKLDKNKLLVSVYKLDDESYNIWKDIIKVPEDKIFKLGTEDNFWQMGDTGPCGPCSEIYTDRGPKFGCQKPECAPGCDCDRFLEVWNLVFMQYNRQPDGKDTALKSKGVDTGMGLERLCSIVQDTESVFETDLFLPLINKIEKLTGINYSNSGDKVKSSFRVLADHIRSTCFAIADGALPSNEGRGYVLRKIIRRAALFAQRLGNENIFTDLIPVLVDSMSEVYPELKTNFNLISTVIKSEVKKFSANLVQGQAILDKYIKSNKIKIISGQQAFKLHDTYGFPIEITKVIAQENNFEVDLEGFEKLMEEQRVRSGKKFNEQECSISESIETIFTGYQEHVTKAVIKAIIVNDQVVNQVPANTDCYVITDKSPFYVECGGQISDQGYIEIDGKKAKLLALKKFNSAVGALIKAPVDLKVEDSVILVVDSQSRLNTMKNHTATHLLQAALISLLGKQVKQSGSVVEPGYLRFDFTYHENLTSEQIKAIEDIVNKKIMENIPLKIQETTLKDATSKGVIAFFGEKYNPEKVRVVEIPGFSAELCGGTHVNATGDIGVFKITDVTALSAGNRRIVALTGPKALETFQESFSAIKSLSQEFKVPQDQVTSSVKKLKDQLKDSQNLVKNLKSKLYKSQVSEWLNKVENINSIPFLFLEINSADTQDLKDIANLLMTSKPGFYFLITKQNRRFNFFATISQEFFNLVSFKNFSAWLRVHGVQGGGKDNSLQGGSSFINKDLENLIKNWIQETVK